MAGEFYIKTNKMQGVMGRQAAFYPALNTNIAKIERAKGNLIGNYDEVKRTLSKIITKCNDDARDLKKMHTALGAIVRCYMSAENEILQIKVDKINIDYNSDSKNDAENYWWEALLQMLLGDFYDGDANLAGITGSVILGFIPIVGQICDIRDLIASVYNLIDDGPETKEWVALGFNLVAVIPGIGDLLKHADELGPILKHADNIADGLGDFIKGVIKKGEDVFTAAGKYIDEFNDTIKDALTTTTQKKIAEKIDDILDGFSDTGKKVISKVSEATDEWLKEVIGVDDIKENAIADYIDSLFGNKEQNTGGIRINNVVIQCIM
ncbi:MAG: hypothetical protein J6A75_11605 [Lachnospiraceae bacterium]|nr:hypothetical protein [Lachnospiraceae bacterium]